MQQWIQELTVETAPMNWILLAVLRSIGDSKAGIFHEIFKTDLKYWNFYLFQMKYWNKLNILYSSTYITFHAANLKERQVFLPVLRQNYFKALKMPHLTWSTEILIFRSFFSIFLHQHWNFMMFDLLFFILQVPNLDEAFLVFDLNYIS